MTNIGWNTDDPPEGRADYLVTYTDGTLDICPWTNAGWIYHETIRWHWLTAQYHTVKAWMPLPKPYDTTLDKILDFIENCTDEELPMPAYKKIWAIVKEGET